jgi:(p)ppGpp synthase/HD superfamily hydrolase
MAFVVKSADRLHNLRSAVSTNEKFRRRYILETIEWYFDFSEDIRSAARELAATLSKPLAEF